MKPYLEWSNDLSIGIQEIDEQHKLLVGMINRIHAAIHARDNAMVHQSMSDLAEYTQVHCTIEESVMRILHYPGHNRHKAQHDRLVEQIFALRDKVENGKMAIGLELLYALKTWLIDHFHEEDNKYVGFLLAAGAQPTWQKQSWINRLWG